MIKYPLCCVVINCLYMLLAELVINLKSVLICWKLCDNWKSSTTSDCTYYSLLLIARPIFSVCIGPSWSTMVDYVPFLIRCMIHKDNMSCQNYTWKRWPRYAVYKYINIKILDTTVKKLYCMIYTSLYVIVATHAICFHNSAIFFCLVVIMWSYASHESHSTRSWLTF